MYIPQASNIHPYPSFPLPIQKQGTQLLVQVLYLHSHALPYRPAEQCAK